MASPLSKSSAQTSQALNRVRLLAPQLMSPAQVADLVERARANMTPSAIEGARKQRARNEERRAARGAR